MALLSDHISAQAYFAHARENVEKSVFRQEIEWQRSQSVWDLTEEVFLRETAWVILNSGFRERIARQVFPAISLAFYDWQDTQLILSNRETCVEIASHSFGHLRKLNAMAEAGVFLSQLGVAKVIEQLNADPISLLSSINYIGPVTAWHLAKNLGCDVAKPDRHLVRIADHYGFENVHSLCDRLSEEFSENVAVIDLILWRFSASTAELLAA